MPSIALLCKRYSEARTCTVRSLEDREMTSNLGFGLSVLAKPDSIEPLPRHKSRRLNRSARGSRTGEILMQESVHIGHDEQSYGAGSINCGPFVKPKCLIVMSTAELRLP